MNNNFYEMPQDWYNEFGNNFMPIMNNDLSDPKTGFLRGNLFNNLYDPYKNYQYMDIRVTNKKDEILYNILKYNFALIELQLYLDINPNDSKIVNLYNRYLGEKKKLCDEYERSYGPLTMDGIDDMNKWNWIESPWPWESGR